MTVLDGIKKLVSIALGAATFVLFLLGANWFRELLTGEFNNAGYFALPFGAAFVVIGLLPMITLTHRVWISGSPAARAEAARQRRAEAARFAAAGTMPRRDDPHELRPTDLL